MKRCLGLALMIAVSAASGINIRRTPGTSTSR